jgi:hypothetical protein
MNRMIRHDAEKDTQNTFLPDEKLAATQPPQF